jgi:Family of unknown function (DUF5681)
MSDDDVGYGKPPKHSRFKPGNNANPKGRPKRKPAAIADIVNDVSNGVTEYRERGQTKKATRWELAIRSHVKRALLGDLKSIEAVLLLLAHARSAGDGGVQRLEITDWLPDYPSQTGEQKTQEFAARANTEAPAWWKDAERQPEDDEQ